MDVKKYEFTGETKIDIFGRVVKQIRALIRIERFNIDIGDVGGWIECEENLSQDDDA